MFEIMRPARRNAMTYNPFRELENLERAFFSDPFFAPAHAMSAFRTDIRLEGDNVVLEAELPGFAKEEINLELKDDVLTISAEHSTDEGEKDENGKYITRERRYGSYSRSFDVSEINADEIAAEYNNGVLKLTMPKKAPVEAETRRISIN